VAAFAHEVVADRGFRAGGADHLGDRSEARHGAPGRAAPEQLAAKQAAARSDTYALGLAPREPRPFSARRAQLHHRQVRTLTGAVGTLTRRRLTIDRGRDLPIIWYWDSASGRCQSKGGAG